MTRLSEAKILYLVHRVPFPPNRGDRIRSYHLLRFLSERARVWLGCLADEAVPSEVDSSLQQWCEQLAVYRLPRQRRWANAALSLATGRAATEGLFASQQLRQTLKLWSNEQQFDAVVVFCSSMMQYLDLPELKYVPKIVDLVDVDSQKWLDYAAEVRGPKRWLYQTEAARLRRIEQQLPEVADAILLTTEPEATLYRSFCPSDRARAICNGVDLNYFCPQINSAHDDCRLVFVGALDYRANIEGVLWFAREVWPHVHAALPESTWTLVGRKPVPAVEQLARLPGVSVAADVPDVRPYLAEATISIVPLRVARGVQNKILESLAMAKAVVASPQAIDGLDVAADKHLCEAAEPGDWVNVIRRLTASPDAREAMGRAGRAYVEQHHCWSTCLEPLAEILDRVLSYKHGEQLPTGCLTETR